MQSSRLRILLVDDSRNMRILAGQMLEKNFEVEILEAGNGEEAERLLQEAALSDTPVDLVFLDLSMPVRTGLDFLKSVRATERFRFDPPIVMLSSDAHPKSIEECMDHGANQFVSKPFREEDLVRAVRKAMTDREEVSRAV